jgi:hypothetical protein
MKSYTITLTHSGKGVKGFDCGLVEVRWAGRVSGAVCLDNQRRHFARGD